MFYWLSKWKCVFICTGWLPPHMRHGGWCRFKSEYAWSIQMEVNPTWFLYQQICLWGLLCRLLGSIKFGPTKRFWKTWVPFRCRFFVWLVYHNRVWIADRLAKRNMPHWEACPFCDQEGETIHHLLIGCVFACEVWTIILQQLGLLQMAPHITTASF